MKKEKKEKNKTKTQYSTSWPWYNLTIATQILEDVTVTLPVFNPKL